MGGLPRTYSLVEVAAATGWKTSTLRDAIRRGDVTAYRAGRNWRFTDEQVKALTEYRPTQPSTPGSGWGRTPLAVARDRKAAS